RPKATSARIVIRFAMAVSSPVKRRNIGARRRVRGASGDPFLGGAAAPDCRSGGSRPTCALSRRGARAARWHVPCRTSSTQRGGHRMETRHETPGRSGGRQGAGLGETAKETASELGGAAKDVAVTRAQGLFDGNKRAAAEQIGAIANALRNVSS